MLVSRAILPLAVVSIVVSVVAMVAIISMVGTIISSRSVIISSNHSKITRVVIALVRIGWSVISIPSTTISLAISSEVMDWDHISGVVKSHHLIAYRTVLFIVI